MFCCNAGEIREIVHSIKGASANIRFSDMKKLCMRIEDQMTKDTKQIPEQLLREIEIEFLRLNDFVKKNTQLTGVIEDDENQETGEE